MKKAKKKLPIRKKLPKPHPVDIHVDKHIRHFHHLRRMSQADLAEQIGVKFQQLHRYESADNRISASKLKMAAEALNVSVNDLFEKD